MKRISAKEIRLGAYYNVLTKEQIYIGFQNTYPVYRVYHPDKGYGFPYKTIKQARLAQHEGKQMTTATKIFRDDVEELPGVTSIGVGSIWLYFLNEALVGVISMNNEKAYLLKIPVDFKANEAILPSHLPPSKDWPNGITEKIIAGIIEDADRKNLVVERMTPIEIQEKSIALLSGELASLIDERMGLT